MLSTRATVLFCCAVLVGSALGFAQTPDNSSLTGRYYFRHLFLVAEGSGGITLASTAYGVMTFDGAGKVGFQGQQIIGAAPPINFGTNGTYQVQSSGFVTITNPQNTTLTINGRLGFGSGMVIGASTEAPANITDMLVALAAPRTPVANGTFNGTYRVAEIAFPSGFATQARGSFFSWLPTGQGTFSPITVAGHAANLAQQVATQTVTGGTYTILPDGSGTALFPLPQGQTPATSLLGGNKAVALSGDGTLMIGGSADPGGHEIIVAVKAFGGSASNASLSGLFYTAGLSFNKQGFSTFAGSTNSPGTGTMLATRRLHAASGVQDFTGVNAISLRSDGTGTLDALQLALGAGGAASVAAALNPADLSSYELQIGMAAPTFSGPGVFISPASIVNAASFAPVGAPLAPGELFTIFGSGLATQTAEAAGFPLPLQLAGVQVLVNGNAVPLLKVAPTQISAFMPFNLSGAKATVSVNSAGKPSNSVEAPLARTSPGIFTADFSGSGRAVVIHSDNVTPVTPAQPALRGETIVIYMTGLGTTTPPVGDGLSTPASPPARVDAPVTVYIGGRVATIVFQGLTAGFASLYQVNVIVPSDAPPGPRIPLAVATSEAFHDQVDIAVQ